LSGVTNFNQYWKGTTHHFAPDFGELSVYLCAYDFQKLGRYCGYSLNPATAKQQLADYDNLATQKITDLPSSQLSDALTFYFAGLDAYCHHMYIEQKLGKKLDVKACEQNYVKQHLNAQFRYIAIRLNQIDPNWRTHTLVALTADHGMTNVKARSAEVFDRVADVLENTFCIGDCDDNPRGRNVVLAVNGGLAHVYIRNRKTKKWSGAPRLAADIEPALRALLGDTQLQKFVAAVLFRPSGPGSGYRRAELVGGQLRKLSDSGYDQRRDSLIQKLDSPRSGDVLIVLKDGYYFDDPEQYPGNHGGLAETDLKIPLVLAGPGIKPGKDKYPASNTQIAATVYRFLTGNNLPGAEGRLPLNSSPSK
jgi:hypothetical protein